MDFLGIGAQKAGTTWLFKRLAMHPEIYFPLGKECHYWNTSRWRRMWNRHYRRAFKQTRLKNENGWKCGEITPAYAMLPSKTIAEVKALSPDARVFFVARDPVSRAWSAVRHRVRRNIDELDATALARLAVRDKVIARSNYAATLARWGDAFPVKVLLYDDIQSRPARMLDELCEHIGIDTRFYAKLPDDILREAVFSGQKYPVPPGFADAILAKHEADIRAVEAATGRDLSHWRCPDRFDRR